MESNQDIVVGAYNLICEQGSAEVALRRIDGDCDMNVKDLRRIITGGLMKLGVRPQLEEIAPNAGEIVRYRVTRAATNAAAA